MPLWSAIPKLRPPVFRYGSQSRNLRDNFSMGGSRVLRAVKEVPWLFPQVTHRADRPSLLCGENREPLRVLRLSRRGTLSSRKFLAEEDEQRLYTVLHAFMPINGLPVPALSSAGPVDRRELNASLHLAVWKLSEACCCRRHDARMKSLTPLDPARSI